MIHYNFVYRSKLNVRFSSSLNFKLLKKKNFYLKDDFFSDKLNCKSIAKKFSTSSFLSLPRLKEQTEKTLIFFHDDLWEEEEKFRSRYCLRIIFALKKFQENNPRPTVSNALLDLNIVSKNVKLALSYLKNSLVSDLDRVNSKFLLFLYFLTKTNFLSIKNNKRKFILRNLFFSFIFFDSRREYFLNLSNTNSLISKSYILYKPRIRYVTSIFPQGLFLLLYSPYKSSFQFSSTNLLLSRQFLFSKRLTYIKSLLSNVNFHQKKFVDSKSLSFSKVLISDIKKSGISNFSKFFSNFKFLNINSMLIKNKIYSLDFSVSLKKKNRSFSEKIKFARYNNNINLFSKKNSKRKFFIISSNLNFFNNFYFTKFLRKFFWRQLNKFKLRIYRLSFYFYRRFPKGLVSFILKLISKFRFFFSEFMRYLNFSCKSFSRLNVGLFYQRVFLNFFKIEQFLFFFDSFNNTVSKKLIEKKKISYSPGNNSVLNNSFVLFDNLKSKVLRDSFSFFETFKITKVKFQKNFDLLLKLNLTFEINSFSKKFLFQRVPYEITQSNAIFFIESFKFLDKFRFTLKFLLFSKFFFLKKFINIFSSFFSLFYLLFNTSYPYSILQNFKFYPLFYYYKINSSFSDFKILNDDTLVNFFDFLLNKYKNFFNNFLSERTQSLDYEVLRNKLLRKRLINFKFLRKNTVQKFIIDRQNLRNLEFLSDHMKRFVKKLKDLPKSSRSSSFLKYFNFNSKRKLRKKKFINNLSYSDDIILNSKKKYTQYLAYKARIKKYRRRIKNYKEKISLIKSHIVPAEYFLDSYFYRFSFKKYITRLEFRRERKRFFINVLFFNKFIKEKRISVIYHKLLKGSHKITVFHKFSNPFFLRLKLKRYFVFRGKLRRTLNRFSFLTSSVDLKLSISKMMYLIFSTSNNFNKILHSSVSKLLSLSSFFPFNFRFNQFQQNEKLTLLNWLSSLKIKYSNFILHSFYISNFSCTFDQKLIHYFSILKFLRTLGVFIFLKNFYELVNEVFFFLRFLESLKKSYNAFVYFNSRLYSHKKLVSNNFSIKQFLFSVKSSRNYSTYLVKLNNLKFKNKQFFKLKYFFFNDLTKRFFVLNNFSIKPSSNFLNFANFFYLCYFKIFFFYKNIFYDFLKFFKQINQLILFFSYYSFPFVFEKYLLFNSFKQFFAQKNFFFDFSKSSLLTNQVFGVGFFTFFYSSFRNSYTAFSRSIYSLISARRLKYNPNKIKKKKRFKKNVRKQVYYHKYNSPNSVYYLSSKRRIYKGFRFFKPNYPYHKLFPYYINYKQISKKFRKTIYKNVLFFKAPYKKNYSKFKKSSLIFSKSKKKEKIEHLRTVATERTFNISLYKKKKVNSFKSEFFKKKKIYNRFFYLSSKTIFKKSRNILRIPSSSLPLIKTIFSPSIYIGTLLQQRLNSTFKKFSVHPFKKLFQYSQYSFQSPKVSNNSNLFFDIFKISKNVFLNFYSKNLLNLKSILLNVKIQRFFRLLISVCNQISLYSKSFNFSADGTFFQEKNFFHFHDYLFSLIYFELFFYSDFYLSFKEYPHLHFLFLRFILNNEINIRNFYLTDLFNFFYFENFFTYVDFFVILSNHNYNCINNFTDFFFLGFANHSENSIDTDLLLIEKNITYSDFFNDSNFFFQFIRFYLYIITYQNQNLFYNQIVLLNSLVFDFKISFLRSLESISLIRFLKKDDLTFVALNNNFFYFLTNFVLIFFRKFSTFLISDNKLFSFVLNIFSPIFEYDLIFHTFVNNLSKKLNFSKLDNLKIDVKFLFFRSLRSEKNKNILSLYGLNFLRKKSYVHFKYRSRYKKFLVKTSSPNVKFKKKVSTKQTTTNIISHLVEDSNSKINQVFSFLQNQKLEKFSLSNKWYKKSRIKKMRSQRKSFNIKPLHYRFIRKIRRYSKKLTLQKFYKQSFDSKIHINELFLIFFLMKKARNINIFSILKNNYVRRFDFPSSSFIKNHEYSSRNKNRFEPFFKRLLKRLRFNRVKLNKRHLLIKSKIHSLVKQKIFLNFFPSPKFFNFKNIFNSSLFFQSYSYDKLKEKLFLFLRMNRFLEFISKFIIKIKLFIRKNIHSISFSNRFYLLDKIFSLNSFLNILRIYRKVKLLLKYFFNKLIFQVRKKRGFDDKHIFSLNLNSNLSTFKFMFFYNFLSLKFLKSFILRYFFFGEYLKLRFQFINRYLWFRTIPLNVFLLTPKVYIIITKARNNFFVTAIDLYGRILYKSSPGIVKFTGSDRMSKYAWFETSVDFFDGFIEFFRYFLKSKKKKKTSYSAIRIDREYSMRFNRSKKKFHVFMHPAIYHLAERRKLKKKAKKKRSKLKVRLRRFFIISKGISDFNLRIFLKGMVSERFYVSHYFAGAVNYPMRSFSLCRIKKVRRV